MEQEITFGSNPHLYYVSGASHKGEREVLQVNLLWLFLQNKLMVKLLVCTYLASNLTSKGHDPFV